MPARTPAITKIENLLVQWAPIVAAPLALLSLVLVFTWVPTDANLGLSQRIFYWHVPSATACFGLFAIGGLASALYLKTHETVWDHAAHAAVGTGMVFATIVLVTGCIWAHTAWGTWWTWDARLTTFLVLWLVFAGYLLLRSMSADQDMTPRYSAVLCLAGAINIPLVMMATRLWRTIHPNVINNPEGGIDDPRMLATFGLSMVAILAMALWLWALRMRTWRLDERLELMLAEQPHGGKA
jgi:heme exporter protein C